MKDTHIRMTGIWECHLKRQKGLADVTKSRILKWGDSLGLSGGPYVNHKGPYERMTGSQSTRKEETG